MFGSLLLCCFTFSFVRLSVAVAHGNMQLQEGPAGRRRPEPAFLSEIDEWTNGPDPALLSADSGEEHFLIDTESYDKDSAASELQLQGRSMRSSRRCIPHQQSCLGFALPCCDPCDTCYCRFFNAICYCRRIGHTCNPRRT